MGAATISVAAVMSVAAAVPQRADTAEPRCEIAVTVLDRDGNPRLGLTAENFRAKYRGKPLGIVSASLDSRPRRVALVVDTSASMERGRDTAWKAAHDLVSLLTPQNKAVILTLNTRLVRHSELSNDPEVLGQALLKARDAGYSSASALYSAVADVSRQLGAHWDLGDTVVLITDGDDTASALNMSDSITAVASAGVRVCVLSLTGQMNPRLSTVIAKASYWSKGVAEATGGIVVSADSDGVRSLASSIGQLYRVEVMLPQGRGQPQKLELKVVDGGKELEGVKLLYPRLVTSSPGSPDKMSPSSAGGHQMGALYFDPEGADFTLWINRFKDEVYRNWKIPEAAKPGGARGHVDFEFVVERGGTLSSLHRLTSSGDAQLDSAAESAVRDSRLLPLPDDYRSPRVTMQVSFHYNERPRARSGR